MSTAKKRPSLGCVYIKNNYILPIPGIIYSTVLNDAEMVNNLRHVLVDKDDERNIIICFNKPSCTSSRKLSTLPFSKKNSNSSAKAKKDSAYFDFFFMADIITLKPLSDGSLLALFNLVDIFYPSSEDFADEYHLYVDNLKWQSRVNSEYLNNLDKNARANVGSLFQLCMETALRQGINFFERLSDEKDLHNAEVYDEFLNHLIPYLGMSEKIYQTFVTDSNYLNKFEYVAEVLNYRLEWQRVESMNSSVIDNAIKNYRASAVSWKKSIDELEKLNGKLSVNGLESIDEFLKRKNNHNSDDESPLPAPDDLLDMLDEKGDDVKPLILKKIFDYGNQSEGKKVNDKTFYGKYIKKHGSLKGAESRFIDFVNKVDAPDEVKEEIAGEIRKIENNNNFTSADYNTSIDYLETCMNIPFGSYSSEDFDLFKAREIIENSHYGMKDVKKRIYEFLSLRKVGGSKRGAIICLVGPPGVGKTSIAAAVSEALGKQYFRFSAGGVRDEAEFLGHRRTYVAAQPGKIVQGIIRTKTMNPVFLIDEVDKLSSGNYTGRGGDAVSTLLNILDPEQNKNFTDLYLNFPLDLSNILFILTANDVSSMPAPLLDRMEIIEVPSYTTEEKIHIVKDFLLKKTVEKFQLVDKVEFEGFDEGNIENLINSYTKEAGVRGVKSELEKLIRAEINEAYSDGLEKYVVKLSSETMRKYLGAEKYDNESLRANTVGTSIGLAWTSVGGCTLKIEVIATEGKGQLKITGQLGDVMKESVNIAFSYIQSIVNDSKYFSKHDFHLHIPEGATPKDGPSAGITLLCAFYSLYSGKIIKQNLAMTGELTLTGDVMPIGGLREKLYSAKIGGMSEVIIPSKNIKDLADIDDYIKEGLRVVPVDNAKEVLDYSFEDLPLSSKKEVENKCRPIRRRD